MREGLARPNAQAASETKAFILAIKNTCVFNAEMPSVLSAHLCRKFFNFARAFDARIPL
jgi:hypothetical protein